MTEDTLKLTRRIGPKREAPRLSTGRPGPWMGEWERLRWEDRWFPQAFKGTMGQLMMAVQEDAEPEISGRTTLRTMALVEAAYRSGREGRAVPLSETMPETVAP
jgi:predicted dehydrogenase